MIRSAQFEDLDRIRELANQTGITVDSLYGYMKVYEENGKITAVIGVNFNVKDMPYPVLDLYAGSNKGRMALIRNFEKGLRMLQPEGQLRYTYEIPHEATDQWKRVVSRVGDKYGDTATSEWYIREVPENAGQTVKK